MQRRAALKAKAKEARFRLPSWAALLSLLPVITVALTLMGYGYDLAYLEPFGLTPQALQHGPLDFLLRSTYALLSIVETTNELKALISTTEGVHRIWSDTEWMRYAVASGFVMMVLMAILLKQAGAICNWITSLASQISKSQSKPVVIAMSAGKALYKRLTTEWQFVLGGAAAGWIAPSVFVYLLAGVLWIIVSLMIFLLCIAPLIGISAGRSNAHEYVISPQRCGTVSKRDVKAARGASCLRVIKDGKELARGRVIDQTSTRVWLWVKQPWRVMSVPIEDATLEQVELEI